MEFVKFSEELQKNFEEMIANADCLFEIGVNKDELWEKYLSSFPPGTNEIFRERREFDCSCCKQFIRAIGNAVVIQDNQIRTIWGFNVGDEKYQPMIDAMDAYLKAMPVTDVHHSNVKRIGTVQNREQVDGEILTWNHFNLTLDSKFVTNASEGSFKSKHRSNRETLETSLGKISKDSVQTVLELISTNSLYRGSEWKGVLEKFMALQHEYSRLPEDEINNWLWAVSFKQGDVMSKIKNHSIGVLLQDITEGMDLETAVKRYEKIVAPENYKRPKPIFTKKMLENAQAKVEELGLTDSLARRFATVDDITIRDLLYADRSVAKQMGVFDELASSIPENPKKFGKVEEISIEDFLENVLPKVSEMEVMVENRHATNLVSLIAPVNADSKTMFKWDNNFGWTYKGNIADSSMKDNVKAAGGDVSGDLRFSIQWNDGAEHDRNDLDAHCIEPNGHEIMFTNRGSRSSNGGMLDVDITGPKPNVPAVENITFADRSRMKDGVYQMFVHNYAHRGGTGGFRAEIEFDGTIHSFDYPKDVRGKSNVHVAEVTLSNGVFSIKEAIPSELQAREMWNITTNQFVKVSAVCLSPNYWGTEVGNKHYMFMLQNCINPDNPSGFFNEYLTNDLREHRKVFAALASKMAVKDSDDQLSGLGFSETQRNDIIVRVKGHVDRMLKVKF